MVIYFNIEVLCLLLNHEIFPGNHKGNSAQAGRISE
jgi:hypothetical protein